MLIHTVVQGEGLRDIAARYGTTTRELQHLNELQSENIIVPGLHLLVPGPATLARPYTVQSGDTVESIARRQGVTPDELRGWLGLRAGQSLRPQQRLYVPTRVQGKRTIEVNGYLLPEGNVNDSRIVQDTGQRLTYLCIFSYQARADGSLVGQKDNDALSASRQLRVAPLMTVTNFDGTNFNTELAHTVMSNPSIRRKLMDNILRTARNRGFRGINVDFEHMQPSDRPLYNEFISELGQAVRRQGLSISIAMGPKTSDEPTASWMGAFDYRTLGGEVDFIMLMTYEWGWVGGPPMAIAPLDQVRAVLNYATSVIPSSKLLMGMALYGYDWPLPHPQAGRASGISNKSAQNLAMSQQVPIEWSVESASPFFRYRDSEGRQHVVWFEDALSAAVKLQLIYDYGMRGASFWVLGNEFPQVWHLIRDSFNVRKV
jgi:spore germination protein